MSCLAITIILYYRYYRTVVNILHNKRSKIPSKYHSEISRNSHKFKEVGPVHMSVLGPSMALAGLALVAQISIRSNTFARLYYPLSYTESCSVNIL